MHFEYYNNCKVANEWSGSGAGQCIKVRHFDAGTVLSVTGMYEDIGVPSWLFLCFWEVTIMLIGCKVMVFHLFQPPRVRAADDA